MGRADKGAAIGAADNFGDARLDGLKGLPVTANGQGIATLAIIIMMIGIPAIRTHSFDQVERDVVSFDG
jgi:hypothetical protein